MFSSGNFALMPYWRRIKKNASFVIPHDHFIPRRGFVLFTFNDIRVLLILNFGMDIALLICQFLIYFIKNGIYSRPKSQLNN